jgi:hypothetical protein
VVFENKSQYCFDHFAGSHCYLSASGVMLRHSTPSRLPQCENLEIFNQETKTILDTVKENLLFLPPKPVPQFISGRNFTQVENDVNSDTILERAEKILAEAKKVKIFETMSNATSLQVYVDEFDRYMLKAKAFMIDDEKIFERILNHLTLIIDLLKDNSYSSKREFYYSDKELFEYKQVKYQLIPFFSCMFPFLVIRLKCVSISVLLFGFCCLLFLASQILLVGVEGFLLLVVWPLLCFSAVVFCASWLPNFLFLFPLFRGCVTTPANTPCVCLVIYLIN